ncbi:hypothetical protein OB920_20650 [Halobacteria archaeon HArc-gm2]|nr:hypothetical protein [Halobacteria archaeon HArc-gm2]
MALDVAGTDPATGAEATLTGSGFTRSDNYTASGASLSSSQSLSADGNLEPQHSDGGDPVLGVTANAPTESYNPVTDEGDGTTDLSLPAFGDDQYDTAFITEMKVVPNYDGKIETITLDIAEVVGSDYGALVDVRIGQESPDDTFGEGTSIAKWDPSWSAGTQTITVDDPPSVSKGQAYTIEFITE